MVKAVIFDLDGTIGDTLPLIIKAFREAIEPSIGRSLSDEEIMETFGPSAERTILALVPEHYEEVFKSYLHNYQTHHAEYPEPFDGIKELMQYLKSKQLLLGLVTSKGAQGTQITLRQYGMENVFDGMDTGVLEGPRKPEGLKAVLSQFGIQPQEAVYVGDTATDIMVCRQVGIPVISAAWSGMAETEKLKEMNPNFTFESVKAFSDYLKSIL